MKSVSGLTLIQMVHSMPSEHVELIEFPVVDRFNNSSSSTTCTESTSVVEVERWWPFVERNKFKKRTTKL